jgi:flavin prenyltransferase
MGKRIIVGISGASGAIYAQRVVRLLLAAGVEVHLVVTPLGQRLLHDELGMEGLDLWSLTGLDAASRPDRPPLPAEGEGRGEGSSSAPAPGFSSTPPGLVLHHYRDVGAPIASGSFAHQGMVIIPCSSNTLSAVATGSAQNLLHRAAQVTLKERRRLILVHRETPLSLVDIRNMAAATEAGAIIFPASPGFYMLPRTIDDLVDFLAGRVLDLLGVEHQLPVRWGDKPPTTEAADKKSD